MFSLTKGRQPKYEFAEHKITPLYEDWDSTKFVAKEFHKWLGSVRSRTLQKLLLIQFKLLFLRKDISDNIKKRLSQNGYAKTHENFATELTYQEIMELIGCKERTAKEYKRVIELFSMGLF